MVSGLSKKTHSAQYACKPYALTDWVQEPGPDAAANLPNEDAETRRHTLRLGIAAERVLRLRDANWNFQAVDGEQVEGDAGQIMVANGEHEYVSLGRFPKPLLSYCAICCSANSEKSTPSAP